jgi:putative ABC transport system permease protein
VFHHDDLGASAFPVKEVEVIGVVKDFHYQSLHYDIQPMMFGWNHGWTWMVSAQISPQDLPGTIDYIGNVWNEFSPDYPFTYEFIDEMFASQYHSEERLGKTIGYFAILGIFIACLGLFGLVSFMAEQRTKEIGIRKVLGASVSGIIVMLSKEFSRWVLLANITAWPIAYLAMHKWLQSFAYRTSIGIGTFLLSALLAFAIAMFTVSYQALRAATANPVESLRYE